MTVVVNAPTKGGSIRVRISAVLAACRADPSVPPRPSITITECLIPASRRRSITASGSPSLAATRAASSSGIARAFYSAMALGVYDISPKARELDHKIIRVLAAIGIPMAWKYPGRTAR